MLNLYKLVAMLEHAGKPTPTDFQPTSFAEFQEPNSRAALDLPVRY